MNYPSSQDRRSLCRIPLQLPMELLTYNDSRQSHMAMSVNLHYRGAEIVTDTELRKGTSVTLRLPEDLTSHKTDSTHGVIRWAYSSPDQYKYGIAFQQDCRWDFLLTQQQLLKIQKRNSALASSVLNALDQGVFSVNKHWQITLFNKAAEKITGWQQSEVLGKKCQEFFSSDLCNDSFLTEAFRKGLPVVKRTLFAATSQGHQILLKITASPLFTPTGEIDGVVQRFSPVSLQRMPHKKLQTALPASHKKQPAICIQTLGRFALNIDGKPFYDRMWKGRRSKELLKAIIALGGTKISMNRLASLLWPDSDGDRALNNLKMALSRLRRIGGEDYSLPANWLVVKHHRVSLTRDHCRVDAHDFNRDLKKYFNIRDHIHLQNVLLHYTDDFLPQDSSSWVIPYREQLRTLFIEGVLHLATLKHVNQEILLTLLEQACRCAPLHEEVYGCLMQLYLQMGYPATALKIFNKAKATLRDKVGISPGIKLQSLANQAK